MRKIFLLTFLALVLQQLEAQERTPYSRYGLGFVSDNNTAQSAQMGGLGAAFQSAEAVNYLNPASYASLQFTTFDAGIAGNFTKLKTQTQKSKQNSFSLNYLSIFFPANKYWTTGASLLPFSAKDYAVSQSQSFDSSNIMKFEYEGNGTLYNLSWGNGFKYKGLSVGFNIGYLFGKLNNNSFSSPLNVDGSYDNNAYTTWSFTNLKASSFIWNAGAQYKVDIKSKKDSNKTYNVVFGLAGTAPVKFSKRSYVDNGIYNFQSGYLVNRNSDAGISDFVKDYIEPKVSSQALLDTLSEKFNQSTSVKLPATFNVGIVASQGIKWKVGVDFKLQTWSKYVGYENNAASVLKNSWRVAVGGEFLPNDKNFSKFFSRMKYRAGFNYTRTNININNQPISEYGINFGLGIPLIVTTSSEEGLLQKVYIYAFNLGVEVGSRGTIKQNLVRENFVRLKIGLSLNDRWFVKRRYY